MDGILQAITLRVKTEDGSALIGNITLDSADNDLFDFAEAYNSLQSSAATGYIKRSVYQYTA